MEETTIHSIPAALLAHIFSLLPAKDLARISSTCSTWRHLISKDIASNKLWRDFYGQRWSLCSSALATCWHAAYNGKMQRLKCWQGRYTQDQLYGHKAGVKACSLLPSHNILLTGSVDKTMRLWDLHSGMPIAASKPHGGTVRCVALDADILASGSTDNIIRVWFSQEAEMSDGSPAPRFSLSSPPSTCLAGHRGPLSTLSLTEHCLYSGSWDYSVRIWSRSTWECASVLTYDDWVFSVAARGNHLLVSAGPEVYVHDIHTGQTLRKFQNLHDGHVSCLEGTQNSRMLFTGASDGLVLAHDLRMKDPSMVLWHHNAAVHSLSFEDPWLASASSDGSVIMLNTEAHLRKLPPSTSTATGAHSVQGRCLNSSCRQLQSPGGPAYCVDIREQWLACGSESETVRVWDFTKAAEAAERAAVAKASRNSRKRGCKHTPAHHPGGPPQQERHGQGNGSLYSHSPPTHPTFMYPKKPASGRAHQGYNQAAAPPPPWGPSPQQRQQAVQPPHPAGTAGGGRSLINGSSYAASPSDCQPGGVQRYWKSKIKNKSCKPPHAGP